ncbi:MAG TPA: hypothetical protein PK490_20215 [Prosthecobacter sp.]|nr:hypothetical protein [Prosthecobacter sp.]
MKHRLAFAALLLACATAARAQNTLADAMLDKSSGTSVKIQSVFDPSPALGYAPVRVLAVNGTNRDSRWSFDFESVSHHYGKEHRHDSRFTLDMPAGSSQSAAFLVPLSVAYGNDARRYGTNHQWRGHVNGAGFATETFYEHENRVTAMPAIALSNTLADQSMAGLKKEIESKRGSSSRHYGHIETFGSQFDPADLPESWLGFSGFDFLLLTHTDWQKLKAPARRALLDWVRLGGRLHLYTTPGVAAASLGLPAGAKEGRTETGLGEISVFGWDGTKLAALETVNRYWGEPARLKKLVERHSTASDWPLLGLLGERSFASWQVIAFLVIFGILVGPVNLFVLAPSGRRHRLFLTTPLLSLGASVIMVVLILVQDGTGGTGRRFVHLHLEPDDAAAFVTQEQVCRTGVLLGAAFETAQPATIEPLALPDTQWVKLKSTHNTQAVQLTQNGRERRGNYFQSRTEQGHLLRAVVPTRARLELKAGTAPGAAPEVISALGFTVDWLCYKDDERQWWVLEQPLATGASAVLKKAEAVAVQKTLGDAAKPAEQTLRDKLTNHFIERTGWFYARASQAPGLTLDTLAAIRWQDDRILVSGPVVKP